MSKGAPRFLWGSMLVLLAMACSLLFSPGAPGPEPKPVSLTLLEVRLGAGTWACEMETLAFYARVRLANVQLSGARVEYRLAPQGPWQMQALRPVGQQGDVILLEAVVPRTWTSPDAAPQELQYVVVVSGSSGDEIRWPAQEGTYGVVPISCAQGMSPTPSSSPTAALGEAPPSPLPAPQSPVPQTTATPPSLGDAVPSVTPEGWVATVLPSPTSWGLVPTVLPTSTPGGFVVTVLPSPTAKLIKPYSNGQEDNLQEWNFFDLDEGRRLSSFSAVADFQLYPGNDPYQDQIRPFNGASFGWFGAGEPNQAWPEGAPPSQAECNAIEHVSSPITILWPEMQNTYFCYRTNAGRPGWLRVDVWVSLPQSERRLVFTWLTWEE